MLIFNILDLFHNFPIQISKVRVSNKEIILRCISLGDFVFWYIQNFCDFTNDDFNPQ